MDTKKNWNTGKIVVLLGAIIIMILVALWCGHLLKSTQKQQPDVLQTAETTTMALNVMTEATTTELIPMETTTIPMETEPQLTVLTTVPNENALDTNSNGEFRQYVIKLANPLLNIHSEPSYNGKIVGVITDRGSYVITNEATDDEGNKWGLLDSEFGWINLADARNTEPDESTYQPADEDGEGDENAENSEDGNGQATTRSTTKRNNNNNSTTTTTAGHSNNSNGNGGLLGIDADGDGWDDGWNPDAWCIICGYDSYWNEADGCYHCSQGHSWNY